MASWRRKLKLSILLVATVILIFQIRGPDESKIESHAATTIPNFEKKDDSNIVDFPDQGTATDIKLVLLWTRLYKIREWWREGYSGFSMCQEKRCAVTTDRARLSQSNAVVFHVIDLGKPGMADMPVERPPGQLWVFRSQESPYRVYLGSEEFEDLSPLDGLFNLTMTYRGDSDISDTYGWYRTKQHKYDDLPEDHIKHRVKTALWFVSNCNLSRFSAERFKFVKRLAERIPIDIYGKCGEPDPCEHLVKDLPKWWACETVTKRKYKFYIAFENCRCREYVTEKFWWALHQGVVPVVMGASYEDYVKIAPPKSFIHVDQFKNIDSLVEYLGYLNLNDTAYEEYYKWRGVYEIMIGPRVPPWCKLCELLHNEAIPQKVYRISQWFNRQYDCHAKYYSPGLEL